MNRFRNILFILLGLALIAWSAYEVFHQPAPARYQSDLNVSGGQKLTIGEKTLNIEVADTDDERMQGLSDRDSLPRGSGMLFIFEKPGVHGFWMKDMRFPIDIVWLDESYKVVDIARSMSPNSFPHVFYPPRPVKYVLETNPGEL